MESIKFAPIIVGTMRLGEWGAKMNLAALEKFVEGCLEMGLNDFDHADIYGHYSTESDFGKLLKLHPSLRQKMQITTKGGICLTTKRKPEFLTNTYNNTKSHLIQQAEDSLRNLETDYLDLYLVHRPDFLMDPYEIAAAFSDLKAQGKVKHFGVSNFTPTQFDILNSIFPLETNQVEISITRLDAFEDGTLLQCQKNQIAPTSWSPLGGGKVFEKTEDEQILRIQKVGNELAKKYGVGLDQILLAWLLKHPSGIIPVIGTSKIARVKSAMDACKIDLTRQEWYLLWKASMGKDID
ncbi:MAG: aldo/keto reductase family oxidoreductase [Saprospiraceae bacterium]